jgi:hypothetical protein
VPPQPKVTLVQSTPRQSPPPPQKPHPQKQYYIPSHQSAQQAHDDASQPTVPDYSAPTLPEQTVQPTVVQSSAQGAVVDPGVAWGSLAFSDGQQNQLKGERVVIGRYDHDLGGLMPDIDLGKMPGADTVSRVHAALEAAGDAYTLIDLNSTNSTRINGKRLEPDNPMPINDGDTIQFGKVTCTFKKDR